MSTAAEPHRTHPGSCIKFLCTQNTNPFRPERCTRLRMEERRGANNGEIFWVFLGGGGGDRRPFAPCLVVSLTLVALTYTLMHRLLSRAWAIDSVAWRDGILAISRLAMARSTCRSGAVALHGRLPALPLLGREGAKLGGRCIKRYCCLASLSLIASKSDWSIGIPRWRTRQMGPDLRRLLRSAMKPGSSALCRPTRSSLDVC